MNITAADVNKLRTMTGAGMMDCKKALTEAEGDFELAVELLPMNALPKHIASSPFKWTPSSILFRYFSRISVTFGTLIPPPSSST